MTDIVMTKRLEKAMKRIRRHGGAVIVHHGERGGNYFCTPDGLVVSPGVVSKLQRLGELTSSEDGLFPAIPQTLRLKE
jgi:hypothetical protein